MVGAIPRGTLGKVQREELKKILQEVLEAEQVTDLRQGNETERPGDDPGA